MNSTGCADLDTANLGAMILDEMLDAVILADPDGVIRLWNRGAEVIFGYSSAEAIGAPLDMIVPQRLKLAHSIGFRNAVRSGHLKTHGEVMTTRANHKYGCRLYVDFSFGLLKDEGGALLGVFAVGRDVTVRHMEQIAMAN
ncbi:PAS domain S-box protein [Ramlibacter henchirensis]|nr:PAS domain S-box protein [Ramlibacter henchirensis]